MNLVERIAQMAQDNAIAPDPLDFRALKMKARALMRLQSDWAFTPKGNMVVVSCKSQERGIQVQSSSGLLATRVLLAALDVYDQESKRLDLLKESHARVSAKLQPLQPPPAKPVLSGRDRGRTR